MAIDFFNLKNKAKAEAEKLAADLHLSKQAEAPKAAPAPAKPAAPAPKPVVLPETGPGGDTRHSGQPHVRDTLKSVADHMKKTAK